MKRTDTKKNPHAIALGKRGRAVNTPAQQAAARENGKRGGRPRGARIYLLKAAWRLAVLREVREQLGPPVPESPDYIDSSHIIAIADRLYDRMNHLARRGRL